jgi:hypothetical protein
VSYGKPFCTEIPAKAPEKRVTVDDRRSGNQGQDGYAVLDQAMKPDQYGYRSKERRGVGAPKDDGMYSNPLPTPFYD